MIIHIHMNTNKPLTFPPSFSFWFGPSIDNNNVDKLYAKRRILRQHSNHQSHRILQRRKTRILHPVLVHQEAERHRQGIFRAKATVAKEIRLNKRIVCLQPKDDRDHRVIYVALEEDSQEVQ